MILTKFTEVFICTNHRVLAEIRPEQVSLWKTSLLIAWYNIIIQLLERFFCDLTYYVIYFDRINANNDFIRFYALPRNIYKLTIMVFYEIK